MVLCQPVVLLVVALEDCCTLSLHPVLHWLEMYHVTCPAHVKYKYFT